MVYCPSHRSIWRRVWGRHNRSTLMLGEQRQQPCDVTSLTMDTRIKLETSYFTLAVWLPVMRRWLHHIVFVFVKRKMPLMWNSKSVRTLLALNNEVKYAVLMNHCAFVLHFASLIPSPTFLVGLIVTFSPSCTPPHMQISLRNCPGPTNFHPWTLTKAFNDIPHATVLQKVAHAHLITITHIILSVLTLDIIVRTFFLPDRLFLPAWRYIVYV